MNKRFLIILALLLATPFYYGHQIYFADNPADQTIAINKGDSLNVIAVTLAEKDVINSVRAFKLYARLSGKDQNVHSGQFQILAGQNIPQIFQTITKEPESLKLTIQEGLTIKEIDQKIADSGIAAPGAFITATTNFDQWEKYPFLTKNTREYPLEGYIYPDTYFLDLADPVNSLITKALANFGEKTRDLKITPDILTMASIVENEVFQSSERPIVAGILWKRLANDWTIGADITLIYATGRRTITAADLALDSPYNTRKNLGLPPGPVSNPSLDSINAALTPKESPYWFYLTTLDTGEVIYSETNEEHNLNRDRYLR